MDSLKDALIDALLAAQNLPTFASARRMLKSVKSRVEVLVAMCKGSSVSEKGLKTVRKLLEDHDNVKVVPVYAKDWPPGRPDPMIAIGGKLGLRYRFYGIPEELLIPPLLTAVAAGGGGWTPESCEGCSDAEGKVVLYVVPGLPCVKAMYYCLYVVYCSPRAELEVVNLDTMYEKGMKLPTSRAPTFITVDGREYVGAPRTPKEAASFWARSKGTS